MGRRKLRQDDFDRWLRRVYVTRNGGRLNDSTRGSRVANCRTVESYEGDLDEHFEKDGLAELLGRLAYSTGDERECRQARHRIPINGNVRNGSATLKSAVSLYQQFREVIRDNGNILPAHAMSAKATPQPAVRRTRRPAAEWPEWPQPDEGALLTLAKSLTPFVRFLHPDIVAAVVDDNEKRRESWGSQLRKCGIDPTIYLWDRSPCVFPGVRRYAGSKEIAQFRGHTGEKDHQPETALRLDDNDFPKQLWSFVFRGKPFQKFGPDGYALAHLADHKEHNNRWAAEFELPGGAAPPTLFFGLYTSAANTVYVPVNFLKPTDFSDTMRTVLQRKAQNLYGDCCTVAPPPLLVKGAPAPEWEIDRFRWSDPVGTVENVGDFLEYRVRTIDALLANRGA